MIRKSSQHLTTNNERYFEHQRFAFRYGLSCLAAACMAFCHGLVPAWFETGASNRVHQLANRKRDEAKP